MGILKWPNGEQYEGEFLDGQFDGYGVFYYANNTQYQGNWKNGKKFGEGQQVDNNGHSLNQSQSN